MKNHKKLYIAIAIILAMFALFTPTGQSYPTTPFTDFKSQLSKNEIDRLDINPSYTDSNRVLYTKTVDKDKPYAQRMKYQVYVPEFQEFWKSFEASPQHKGIHVEMTPPQQENVLVAIIRSILPLAIFIGLMLWFQRYSMGKLSKNKINKVKPEEVNVRFDDIIGIDEIKEEVSEIVDFLKKPEKFDAAGAVMPKGIILSGQPGVGKTMLARSLAKESGVPFYAVSGSSFVEMFVGLGASRVRSLFDEAKNNAPCIIFIDEIDTIGGARSNNSIGYDEKDGTLNELLAQMDGMQKNKGIFIMGATNRVDMLDKALLRAGRFDRQLIVPMPNTEGRLKLLQKLALKYNIAPDVNFEKLSQSMTGLSPAEITNLMNEASILQVRQDKQMLDSACIEEALDKLLIGLGNGYKMTEKDKRITAYHEAGHAVIGLFLDECDPVHKVSITPRGMSLGVTVSRPQEERVHYSKKYLLAQISMLYGGFCAEQLFVGDNTTGASDDIRRATEIAKNMVTVYGLSALNQYVYLGKDAMGRENLDMFSDETKKAVEAEIFRIVSECQNTTFELLKQYRGVTEKIVERLMAKELIGEADLLDILQSENLPIPQYLLEHQVN